MSMDKILEEWGYVRRLSLDYLKHLKPEQLLLSPAKNMGPMWKQFRHIARVQENYTDALRTGSINFATDTNLYRGGCDHGELVLYLEDCDKKMLSAFESFNSDKFIDWFGENVAVDTHLVRLISHETLHHGQWILFGKSLDVTFPSSWDAWGV